MDILGNKKLFPLDGNSIKITGSIEKNDLPRNSSNHHLD